MTDQTLANGHDPSSPLIMPEYDFSKRAKKVEIDVSKTLKWKKPEDALEQFHYLAQHPPVHPVNVEVYPLVAQQLLLLCNHKNRDKVKNHVSDYAADMENGNFEETGDTLKFSKVIDDIVRMLDGQHRLDACVQSKKPFVTDIKFGLDVKIFDVLDQGRKRNGGDILKQLEVPEHKLVAGAVGWVERLTTGTGLSGGLKGARAVKPRRIGELATKQLKGMADFAKPASLICQAYRNARHPPTMLMALLYLIAKGGGRILADSFAEEWVLGAKVGRNKNFDVLMGKLMNIARTNNGVINRPVRAALLVLTFNHWHAGVVANPRSLVWQTGWSFPKLEFNKERTAKQVKMEEREDTSAAAVNHRVLRVLTELMDKNSEVQLGNDDIAELANVHKHSVDYILGELKRSNRLRIAKPGAGQRPATYRVLESSTTIVA